jgi:glycosyl transferase family 25
MENIDKIIYINLDRRTDRRAEIETELTKMGLSAIRFSAFETPGDGMKGCQMSHLEVLKIARDQKWKNVLILEDDFMFKVSREELDNELNKVFKNNIKYDVLMLAYNLFNSQPYNDTIAYARQALTTAGYIINSTFYDEIIKALEIGLDMYIKTKKFNIYGVDTCTLHLQQTKEWFYFLKRLGIQRPSYSDLLYKHVEYNV